MIGPSIPNFKALSKHQMVRIGTDLVVIGGYAYGISIDFTGYNDSIFKLSCSYNFCQWERMTPKLKMGRQYFVAVALPDNFVNCNK